MNDMETQAMFAIEKGKRDSDRLVEECLKQIANILHGEYIHINGRKCRIKVLASDSKVMFDVKNPSDGLNHIEFTIEKTGWEIGLMETTA